MKGEVMSNLLRQVRVCLSHARHGQVDVRIGARGTPLDISHLIDPTTHAIRVRIFLRVVRWRWSHTLNCDDLSYAIRKDSGVSQSNHAAERMTDKRQRCFTESVAKSGQVKDVLRN